MTSHLQDPLTTYPKVEQEMNEEMVSLQAMKIANTLAFPMVLKAALELGVIDTIFAAGNGAWLTPSEISVSLSTKPINPEAPVLLDRMLKLLVSHSILKCRMNGTVLNDGTGKIEMQYAAGPVCKFFVKESDGSGSLSPMFLLLHTDIAFKSWMNFKDLILEGRDAFGSVHGMGMHEYMDTNEQFTDLFNRAMSEESNLIIKKLLEVYKGFEDVNVLVDVGGGIGTILSRVISKYPHIKGVNFDLAHVITHAPSYPGVEHVSGDMFIEIPKGDAIFMKWILHNWTDEHCITILKNCWKSLPEKGKVIIVEMVTPIEPKGDDLTSNVVFGMDLLMLTQCSGGKERSLLQFQNLASASGFLRCEIICQFYSFSVIEFHK